MTDRDFPQFRGLIIGAGNVEGRDIAYVEFPAGSASAATRCHWFMVVGDDGVIDAQQVLDGPLVPGEDRAPRERILQSLHSRVPAKGFMSWKAATEAFIKNEVGDVELDDLIELMCPSGERYADRRERMIEAAKLREKAFAPIRGRLGLRLVLASSRPAEHRGPALRMSAKAVLAFEDFVTARPWLASVIPLSTFVDVSDDPAKDQDEVLGSLGIPRAASRRIGAPAGKLYLETRALIKSVPIDWVPALDDFPGWAAFTTTAEALTSLTGSQEWFARTLVAPSRGKWPEFVEGLARDLGIDGARFLEDRIAGNRNDLLERDLHFGQVDNVIRDATIDANDMLSAFQYALLSTQAVDGTNESVVYDAVARLTWKALIGSRGLREFLAMSRRWHMNNGRHGVVKEGQPIRWEPVLPTWRDERSGIEVVAVADSHALVDEGAVGADDDGMDGLDHCVGGFNFVRESALGHIRILSLRKARHRLSTAEIALGGADDPVRQHRARSNGNPSPEAEAALASYVALPEVQAALHSHFATFDPSVGRRHASPREALERWRPYLAGAYRNLSADDILAALDEACLAKPAA